MSALALLAASPYGLTEELLRYVHGISVETLFELIRDGLATAHIERTRAGDRQLEVAIVTITDAGRAAISSAALCRQS